MAGLLVRCLPPSRQSQQGPSTWRGKSLTRSGRKRLRVRAFALTMFLSVICVALLSGCVTAVSSGIGAFGSLASGYFSYKTAEKGAAVIVTPPLVDYSASIQASAADKLEQLGQPCPRDVVVSNCSAIARMIIDYGDLRQKIRAAKKSN